MLSQLVLTIKKTYEKGQYFPPPISCFDTVKIAVVPFHNILPRFNDNDVNAFFVFSGTTKPISILADVLKV
jgi:hypothetical protein